MAVDAFNSVGGYTVGIPPRPLIDTNGNLTLPVGVQNATNISTPLGATGSINIYNSFYFHFF